MARRKATGYPTDVQWYLDRLHGVEDNGSGWNVYCPVHDDEGSAVKGLSITPNGKRPPLMKCHSPQCGVTLPEVYEVLRRVTPNGTANGTPRSSVATPKRTRVKKLLTCPTCGERFDRSY